MRRVFFCDTADTKAKLADAVKLIKEISSGVSIAEIRLKIKSSQDVNNGIDSKRKLLFKKSAYATCLDECHEKVVSYEARIRTTVADTASTLRAPGS